ncbi:hypothetical protein M0Q50_06590 [bacterium]|jgi:hypothetical protein|nr:hypothetical protein [bacterium]
MKIGDIRDLVITGTFMFGNEGIKEPLSWKTYANKLEKILVKNNGNLFNKSLPICNIESCEKWQSLAKQKDKLIKENENLKQRLIDAGLEKPIIHIDLSRHA